jgi:hypothetical protein
MDVAGEDFRRTLGGFSLSSLGIAVASASALAATACFMHAVLAQRACKTGVKGLDSATLDGFLPGGVAISLEKLQCGTQHDIGMKIDQACPGGTALGSTNAETDIAAGCAGERGRESQHRSPRGRQCFWGDDLGLERAPGIGIRGTEDGHRGTTQHGREVGDSRVVADHEFGLLQNGDQSREVGSADQTRHPGSPQQWSGFGFLMDCSGDHDLVTLSSEFACHGRKRLDRPASRWSEWADARMDDNEAISCITDELLGSSEGGIWDSEAWSFE